METVEDEVPARHSAQKHRSDTGRTNNHRGVSEAKDYDDGADGEPDDEDEFLVLDEQDRGWLGEVMADESDEDEEMY